MTILGKRASGDSMPSTVFVRARWAVVAATVLTVESEAPRGPDANLLS